MDQCTVCQSQMLEYVYDLLDEDAFQSLAVHLENCTVCRAALRAAQGQQQLLATAARLEFPTVQFLPPSAEVAPAPRPQPATADRPVILPLVRPRRRLAWRTWASAAAVLLVLSVPAWYSFHYLDVRRDLERHDDALARLQGEKNNVEKQLTQLEQKQHAEAETLLQKERAKRLSVSLVGSKTLQEQGPNDYEISLRTSLGRGVPAALDVELLDRNKLLFSKKVQTGADGTGRVSLPERLPVEPGKKLTIRVARAGPDGGQRLLEEDFALTPQVYRTHLATDRPVYQPGDTVRFRALTLDRYSMEPAKEKLDLHYTMTGPFGSSPIPFGYANRLAERRLVQGTAAFATSDALRRGIGAGAWEIPANGPEGEYALTVSVGRNRFPVQQRKFLVRREHPLRLHKELDFTRAAYGPGDEVVALGRVTKRTGGAVANSAVTATLAVDGKAVVPESSAGSGPQQQLRTDADGRVALRFRLPPQIDRGQASLRVSFDDGGGAEGLTRTVPVVLKKLMVEFFPEGGRLVPGGRNRVYFRVRTPLGQPAELRGRLLDDRGDEVAQLQTFHDDSESSVSRGLGAFWLTPYRGRTYELKIDSPAGSAGVHKLPTDQAGAVALSVPTVVTTAHEPIVARVRSGFGDRKLWVGAYCRGRLFDQRAVTVRDGEEATVRLQPAGSAGGVYRVTVFEELTEDGTKRLVPRAERLVFRQPRQRLNLAAATDRDTYVSGGRVRLKVTARDENQQPTPAVVMISVVDRAVLALAEDRTARSMPTHFYLAGEVKNAEELEDADFLLSNHPGAALALDLLLGTQGWRRFAEVHPAGPKEKDATVLAWGTPVEPPRLIGPGSFPRDEPREEKHFRQELQKATAGLEAERSRLLAQRAELDEELSEARLAPAFLAAQQKFDVYREVVAAVRAVFPLLGVILLIALALLLGKALGRAPARALPYFSASAACAGLLLLGALVVSQDRPNGDAAAQQQQAARKETDKSESIRPESQAVPDVYPRATALTGDKRGPGKAASAKKDNASAPVVSVVKPGAPATGRQQQDGQADQPGKGAFGNGQGARGFPGASPPQPPTAPLIGMPPPATAPRLPVPGMASPGGAFRGNMAATTDGGERSRGKTPAVGSRRGGAGFDQKREKSKEDEDRSADKDAKGQALRKQMALTGLHEAGSAYFFREFSYQRLSDVGAAAHRDFSPTVYWHPALVLPDGQVDVSFDLGDAVTTYQVTVFGHTPDGRLAAAMHTFSARKPISLDPTTPGELTAGDHALIPLNVANRTGQPRDVSVKVLRSSDGTKAVKKTPDGRVVGDGKVHVEAEGRARQLYDFRPLLQQERATLEFRAEAKPFADSVRRNIRVVAEGFPVEETRSDVLRGQARHDVVLPKNWVPGTLRVRLRVFPTVLADVRQGLEGLARQPALNYGRATTFTPTSLGTFKEAGQGGHGVMGGPARGLGGFGGGFGGGAGSLGQAQTWTYNGMPPSWYAGAANLRPDLMTDEVMRELRRAGAAAPADLEQVRRFLQSGAKSGRAQAPMRPSSSRDDKGADVSDAYAAWLLTDSGKEDVSRELKNLETKARTASDPYFLALVANSLANRSRKAAAVKLLRKVAAAQKEDGHVEPTGGAGPGGRDLRVQATALAVLGWLQADARQFKAQAAKGLRWLGRQRDARGTFGAAPATVLALKALAADATAHKRLQEGGQLSLFVGNRLLARVPFTALVSDALVLDVPNADKALVAGRNAVRVEVTGKNVLPYTLTWSYRTAEPVGAVAAPVKLSTALARAKAVEGETVRLTVRLENATDRPQGPVVAVVGLPAGLAAPANLGRVPVDGCELRGRDLIFSWRELAPRQKVEVPVDLACRVPGEYRGPASRAYLAADADKKTWVKPLAISITPKGK